MVVGTPLQSASFEGAKRGCPDAGVKLLEVECADLEHKAHPALDKLTVRVSNVPRALLYSAGMFVTFGQSEQLHCNQLGLEIWFHHP